MDRAISEKAKDLIAGALDRPTSERDEFLQQQCPDPALRTEIHAWLTERQGMSSSFLEPPAETAAHQSGELSLGEQVGPYLIVESLGHGGMGQVFLGNDVRLHRKVALKTLLSSKHSGAEQRARILREARAAAQINHPNVATIHDIVDHETRTLIVMEYVEGENLPGLMRRERPRPDRVVSIGRQLASALAAAHAKGVIHCDLKPANVQLTGDGVVKVLDFGVAAATAAFTTVSGADADAPLSPQAGTRGYMSPEQMLSRHVDERSDLFSLGIVLFEIATGARAYASTDEIELMAAVTRPVRRADSVDPTIPRVLADLIAKALEVDPAARFQSAAAFGTALEAIEAARTRLAASPRPTPRRLTVRLAWTIALVVGLAALVGVTVRFWAPGVPGARSVAVLPFDGAGLIDAGHLVAGLNADIVRELQRFDLGVKRVTQRAALTDGLAMRLGVDLLLIGSVGRREARTTLTLRLQRAGAGAPVWTRQYDEPEATLPTLPRRVARDVGAALGVSLSANALAPSHEPNDRAYDVYQRGRALFDERTTASLTRSINSFKRAAELDRAYAEPWAGMADAYIALGVPAFGPLTPLEARRLAKRAALKALEINPSLAEANTSLAFAAFFHEWDWAEAEDRFTRAIDLNPQYALAHHWYADYLNAMGRQNEAMREIRLAQNLEPLSIIINRDVAWHLFFQRRYTEAAAQLEETLRMDPDYAPAHTLLARVLIALGQYPRALAELQGPLPGTSAGARLSFMGLVQASSGDSAGAIATLKALRAQASKHPPEYVSPYYLALIETALGQKQAALDDLELGFSQQDSTMVSLNVDPRFDSLRGDARFRALAQRMKFPSAVSGR